MNFCLRGSLVQFKIPSLLSKVVSLSLLFLALTACATVQKPLTGVVPGLEVDTLQSAISISMKTGEHGSAGRGFLIFRYPDRFHVAVLSPFGLTVMDVYSDGERLSCLMPSRQTAYVGRVADLPHVGVLRTFALLKWVVAREPQADPAVYGTEVVTPAGDRISYDTFGLMLRKVSPDGDQVTYTGYSNVNGVAFPETFEIKNVYGDTVRVVFDEPEINAPVEQAALAPNLQGLIVLPLAEFKGM